MNAFRSFRFTGWSAARRARADLLKSAKVLYERRPPWWGRWTYTIIAADFIMTVSMCDLTWNHWTTFEPIPTDSADGQVESSAKTEVSATSSSQTIDKTETSVLSTQAGEWVLRPWYQRAPLAVGQLALGMLIAGMLQGQRSRIIRKIHLAYPSKPAQPTPLPAGVTKARPPPPPDTTAVIQCATHFGNQGRVVPLARTELLAGTNEKELVVKVADISGDFWLNLDGAAVYGEKKVPWDSREILFGTWYGEELGRKLSAEARWKKGPVLQN